MPEGTTGRIIRIDGPAKKSVPPPKGMMKSRVDFMGHEGGRKNRRGISGNTSPRYGNGGGGYSLFIDEGKVMILLDRTGEFLLLGDFIRSGFPKSDHF